VCKTNKEANRSNGKYVALINAELSIVACSGHPPLSMAGAW
jgi:hypothetical protein